MAKISILIVNYNTSDFVNLSLYSLMKLTNNSYEVFILDNNSILKDYKKLKNLISEYKNVYLERTETKLQGSSAHAEGLNYLVKKVETPYFCILDADAVWLRKNWDQILINKLNNKTKVIGTQASGNKPKDFPLMYAIFFETKTLKKLNIDFRPKDLTKLQDTGWKIREKYLNAGFKGKNIEMKNTKKYKKGPFKELICAEYYLDKDYKNIFASHFGRGSTLGVNKYLRTSKRYLYKLPILGEYFLQRKGKREKNEWIKVCRKIVDEQA